MGEHLQRGNFMAEHSRITVDITPKQLDQAMAKEHRPSKIKMLLVIRLVLVKPQTAAEVAELVDLSKSRVQHIIEDFNRYGLDTFLDRENPEFHRQNAFLTKEQELAVLTSVEGQARKGLLVNSRLVKEALETRLDRTVSEMYVHDVLKRHGWRKVDPRPHHPKYNLPEQNAFKDAFAEKLEDLIESHPLGARPVIFMVQDEARFGRISETYSCWAPPGVRPEIAVQRVRQSFYLYGAFAPSAGQIEALLLPKANTEMMSLFLDHVGKEHAEKLVVMMCDRAAWHRSHALEIPENIVLLAMPPVSPELNPAERMWKWIRENHVGNRFFDDLQGAEDAVVEAFLKLDSDPEITRSITSFPYIFHAIQNLNSKFNFT